MKVMLKQQQRVLLGRSDVAGWGAFLKNPVGKHEYLGEYTGELISHREADKRGKIYDRENSSFLFNLNDQASSMSFTEFTFTVTRAMDGCITPFCLDCSIMPATMNEVPGYSFN